MSIEEVVVWYEKNVNYRLTKAFLNFLVKIGIINYDVDLELLNLFLLDRYDNEFIKDGNKFKIKKNRIPVIDNFKDEVKKEVVEPPVASKKKSAPRKFKIESLGGKKLKLVKLK